MSNWRIDHEINRLNDEINRLRVKFDGLEEKLREIEVRDYLEKYRITLDDVMLFDETENFCHIQKLSLHLSNLGSKAKPWTLWDGKIHRTENLINGYLKPTPVLVSDLEAKKTEGPKWKF